MVKKVLTLLLVLVSINCFSSPRDVQGYEIRIDEILPIGYQLAQENKEGAHTVFIFEESGKLESDNQVNIQFSIENGKFGIDWVLRAPRNIEEKTKFVEFAKSKGYKVELRKMNGVSYYRVEEGGSLFTLVNLVITELYGIKKEAPVGLVASGISFK